tara:strand:+ start:268 stop:447 length:180 start_codon:yes stop_codon:yes gene_type:complete
MKQNTPFRKRYILLAVAMLLSPLILGLLCELVLSAAFQLFCCGVLLFCLAKTAYQKVMQ